MTTTLEQQVFRLPDLGEGLTEAEILEWHVSVGDEIAVDAIVVTVETAKASVEVPCPYAGRVQALHADAGEVLDVGKPLISVTPAGSPDGTVTPESRGAEVYREEERAGSGAVLIGYGTGHGGGRRRRRVRPAAGSGETRPASAAVAPAEAAAPTTAVRVISPIVRRLARERGVDLAAVRGTGPAGIIRRCDVEAAAAGTAAAPAPAAVETPAARRTSEVGEERIPLRGIRRTIADKLSRSRREIPDASTWVDVDATGLVQARADLKAAGVDVSLLALLARITVAGLRRFPELNAYVDTEREEIVRLPHVHLGFAAQSDRGLVVPVVRDASAQSAGELTASLRGLTEQARAGTLPPQLMTGGTFTLNNYGVFGVDGSTPIINHPEAAILGVGRIIDKPWVVEGQLAVRKVTQLSLSFDHRVCDGGAAGGFLRYVADCVERPAVLLAHL
jgi:2-oxoisovalerate dehydrogenase E2 component (dihydrolipoyl transacylase)